MLSRRSFIWVTLMITVIHTKQYNILDPQKRPLLSFAMSSPDASQCLVRCTNDLRDKLIQFMLGDINIDSHKYICRSYEEASSCMTNDTNCVDDLVVYSKLTSGFSWACDKDNGYDQFENIFPCVVDGENRNNHTRGCAERCELAPLFTKSLDGNGNNSTEYDEISIQGSSSEDSIVGIAEQFCSPFACYLNCTREQMNNRCPTSGSKIIHVGLSAFDELIDEFLLTTSIEKKEIVRKVPENCRLFFKEREVTAFRFDEKFIRDLFFMMTSRKQRTENGGVAMAEAERIVRELLSKMENEEKPAKLAKWETWSYATCAAMAFVILLNLVGLSFTVYWCLTEKENNNNGAGGINDFPINHFVEPNIRMKIKSRQLQLPLMRTTAIEDSSQELQLRVPRNGNQMQEGDEQTLVVPRWKRRRTLSVPLDPRKRTDSTGSDKFPQVVLLRTHDEL